MERTLEGWKIGDKVVANADHMLLKKDQTYTISRVNYNTLRIKELDRNYFPRRFYPKVVDPVPVEPVVEKVEMEEIDEIKVGDKVIITNLERYRGDLGVSESMLKIFKNNPGPYTVREFWGVEKRGVRFHEVDWVWDKRWVEKVQDKKKPARDQFGRFIKKEAIPKVVKPKPVAEVKVDLSQETVRDALTKKVNINGVGTCSYAMQYEKETLFQVADVCHARLTPRDGYGKLQFIALNMSGHLKNKTKKWINSFKVFLNWVLNQSAFRHVCITKDVEEALKKGILLDPNGKYSQIVSAAVMIRTFTEYAENEELFSRLVNDGVNVGKAWLISNGFYQHKLKKNPYIFSGYGGGHHVLEGTMPFETVIKVFVTENELPASGDKPFKDSYHEGRYKIFKAVCGHDLYSQAANHKTPELSNTLQSLVKPEKVIDGFVEISSYSYIQLIEISQLMK